MLLESDKCLVLAGILNLVTVQICYDWYDMPTISRMFSIVKTISMSTEHRMDEQAGVRHSYTSP